MPSVIWDTVRAILDQFITSGLRVAPYLILGIVLAAALAALVPPKRIQGIFVRAGHWPVVVATLVAVTTPFCSCTTVSLMIPLMAAGIPWGPVFAWLIASPLTSPSGFALVGGVLGWDLAAAQIVTAVGLGLGGGILVNRLHLAGYLMGQSRLELSGEACSCGEGRPGENPVVAEGDSCCPGNAAGPGSPNGIAQFGAELWSSFIRLGGVIALALMIGAMIRVLVPIHWVENLFGAQAAWAIPTAAALGMPLYTSVAGAVPLLDSLVHMGMLRGAALSFLVAGAGASLPALGALFAVARFRIAALYMGWLFVGALFAGTLFSLLS